ncbi:MAG: lysophospholipid acyltransferase family protein [Planctomycetota bacterium]|jgi:lysophospholipid acyltransferase (LPLAT)-like uncharacterized protein
MREHVRTRDLRAEERRRRTEERDRRGRNVPWRRRYRIVRRELGGLVLRWTAPSLLRALAASWRVERLGWEHLEQAWSTTGVLVAMWHGRMLPALPLHGGMGAQVLVSPSDDGTLVKTLLKRFGYFVIRGSTSRQAPRALREMREQLRRGQTVVITPDGPRGPEHVVNIGLAWLARETGLPIMALGVAADRAWHLRSWDRFTIPKPRARVVLTYSEPVAVAADAGEEEMEAVTEQIRVTLLRDEARAFAHLGVDRDWPQPVP